MISSIFNTCLLFNDNMIAIIDLQIDDSLIIDIVKFMKVESRELNVVELIVRLCERLTSKQPLNFNDFIITLDS